MTNTPLLDVLTAIDRLNSWVRSESYRHGLWHSTLTRRIYEMKSAAIERAHRELVCTHRLIETLATCRDCGGDGRYVDTGGQEFDHCHACSNTGRVRLQFVETRIYDRNRHPDPAIAAREMVTGAVGFPILHAWHTPRMRFYNRSFDLPQEIGTDVTWSVNQPGRDLTVDEAARDLLLCEPVFPPRYRHDQYCDDWECRCTDRYVLYLGEVTNCCAHCGADLSGFAADARTDAGGMQVNRLGKKIGRVDFTVAACAACYEARRWHAITLFDVALPPQLVAPQHVAEWVRVNDALAEPKRDGRAA